jgi:hypothetical protein
VPSDIPISPTRVIRIEHWYDTWADRMVIALRLCIRSKHGMERSSGKLKTTNSRLLLKPESIPAFIRALEQEFATLPIKPPRDWAAYVEQWISNVTRAKAVVLEAMEQLERMDLQCNLSSGSKLYLPALMAQHGLNDHCFRKHLVGATRKLLAEGMIERVVIGKYPNRTPRYGLALRRVPAADAQATLPRA